MLTYNGDLELLATESMRWTKHAELSQKYFELRLKLTRHLHDMLQRVRRIHGVERSKSVQTFGILSEGPNATIYGLTQRNHMTFLKRHFRVRIAGHRNGLSEFLEGLRASVRIYAAINDTIAHLGKRPTESEAEDEAMAPLPLTPSKRQSRTTLDEV